MDIFITPFLNNGFLLNALFAGTLVAIACGIVGTFMVLRGLAFLGDALAHGVLPGVASALLWGIPGFVGASVGSLVMIAGITWITKKSRLSADTAIGLLFVGMLASGVVIVSHSQSFSGDLVKLLFGQFLGITSFDLLIQGTVTLLLAVMAFVFRRPFLLLCFSEEQAQVSGYSAKLYHMLLLVMIAMTVIVSFQTVGTLLVFGMLLAPAATSSFVSRQLVGMMIIASGFGILSVYIGLLLSYHFSLSAGGCVVIVAVGIFFIVFLFSQTFEKEHFHG
ncbi:MAG: metal ABC transporter permease [Chlorobium sp.]|nr:MAG: metal ABC transporter permease [Chlorobium sp.]